MVLLFLQRIALKHVSSPLDTYVESHFLPRSARNPTIDTLNRCLGIPRLPPSGRSFLAIRILEVDILHELVKRFFVSLPSRLRGQDGYPYVVISFVSPPYQGDGRTWRTLFPLSNDFPLPSPDPHGSTRPAGWHPNQHLDAWNKWERGLGPQAASIVLVVRFRGPFFLI